MLIKTKNISDAKSSEIVQQDFYYNRRKFLTSAAGLGCAALLPALGSPAFGAQKPLNNVLKTAWGNKLQPTTFDAVTTYNNFTNLGL